MALSSVINPSSGIIHKILVGHNSSWNVLLRVIKIIANRIRYGLGVSQSMKLTSFWWEPGG
jgi:hypothetical protein